ncbi:serine/threonine-protein kinase [Lentisphaerota bacterium ZTH]|nr:serine/threonine protein kinase [Lentisphaerota bacterium]WET06628.1 serine/threonine-protein kinase [Lentisphaerota bacterium ZTH]
MKTSSKKQKDKSFIQRSSLDEGTLDQDSYLSASDLEVDSTGSENVMHTMTLFEDREEIASKLVENEIPELTTKPKDKYKFVRSIGFGGMKAILQVRDRDTTRSVAMAIIPDYDDRPREDVARFIREARITARLEHPNIVPIHDIGVDSSGSPYFTMKLLRGRTLSMILSKLKNGDEEVLENNSLPRLLRVFVKVCNAVAFAHSKNIIHLDLKPENIHIGDYGEVLVLDWGLAKFTDDKDENISEKQDNPEELESSNQFMTLDGVAKGTPGYMAPEQAAGRNNSKDARTDIYAMGSILYAILTFESPLANRRDVKKILHDTVTGNIEAPSEIQNSFRPVPAALEAICLKAMSLDPQERYQSINEMRDDLFAFMSGYATVAEKAGSLKKTFLFINRNLIPLLFLITLMVLLTGVTAFILLHFNELISFHF